MLSSTFSSSSVGNGPASQEDHRAAVSALASLGQAPVSPSSASVSLFSGLLGQHRRSHSGSCASLGQELVSMSVCASLERSVSMPPAVVPSALKVSYRRCVSEPASSGVVPSRTCLIRVLGPFGSCGDAFASQRHLPVHCEPGPAGLSQVMRVSTDEGPRFWVRVPMGFGESTGEGLCFCDVEAIQVDAGSHKTLVLAKDPLADS